MLWVTRNQPYEVVTGEPLWWYAKRRDQKLNPHARVRVARKRRVHQRYVRLLIRMRAAQKKLDEFLRAFEEHDATIHDPERVLAGVSKSTRKRR